MSSTDRMDLCRVTVIAPRGRMDLALPAVVPLADLLPTVLRAAGDGLAEEGLAHGGWAVQRLGEPPLDTGQSPLALGIQDGEILYLRPRRDQLPAAAFDDVVDAIATALTERGDRWRHATGRAVGLVAGALLVLLGLPVLAESGPQWIVPAVACGVLAVGLLVAGGAVSRGLGDGTTATVLGVLAVPYAFLAGVLGAGLLGRPGTGFGGLLTAPGVLVGAAAAFLVAVLAGVLVAVAMPVFLAAAFVPAFGVVGGLVALASSPAGGAATAVAVALALTPMMPMLGYRLAALPTPFVPTGAQDLRRDEQRLPGDEALRKAVVADQVLTGLVVGTATVAGAAEVVLGMHGGWAASTLCGLVAALLALRSRLFTGRAQRLWLLGAALLGAAVVAVRLAAGLPRPGGLAAVLVPLLVLASVSLAVAMRAPDRRRGPFLGRLADIVELLGVVAVVPVALAVLGVYGYVRTLWG